MKKRFITAAAMAAVTATVLLNGCTSPQTSSLVSSQTETESPATEQVQTEESTKAPETAASETEAEAEDVVRTEAVYVKDSEFADEGKRVFHNDTLGDFICILSDFTVMPEELKDGETYVISHSMVMTMSLPGQLPQVYSIRTMDDPYQDSIGTVKAIEEDSVLFERADGSQFMVNKDSLGNTTVQEGDLCVVSHTQNMTRSMPGTYMEVNAWLYFLSPKKGRKLPVRPNPLQRAQRWKPSRQNKLGLQNTSPPQTLFL